MKRTEETEGAKDPEGTSFANTHLAQFKKNNPHCAFSIQENHLIIQRPWGTEDARLAIELSDTSYIQDLNNIAIKPMFDAIVHLDRNEIEFFYAYLPPDEEPSRSYLNRQFKVFFQGQGYDCRFDKPTTRVYDLASRLRRLPPETATIVAPQLFAFRDAQRLDTLPTAAKNYFKGKEPRSFFIRPQKDVLSIDLEALARHLNFVMTYYDRRAPDIVIRQPDFPEEYQRIDRRRFLETPFPSALTVPLIDDFFLQLLDVARGTDPRFAFIYYYQVFEYAGFYFVDEKAKRDIRRFLRDPAVIDCPEDRISELFSLLSEAAQSDEARMRKVIEEYCDASVVWGEIQNDRQFFENDISFEGGFELLPLIAKETTIENHVDAQTLRSTHKNPELFGACTGATPRPRNLTNKSEQS